MSPPARFYLGKKRGLCARNDVALSLSAIHSLCRARVAKFARKFRRKSAGRVTPVRNCRGERELSRVGGIDYYT